MLSLDLLCTMYNYNVLLVYNWIPSYFSICCKENHECKCLILISSLFGVSNTILYTCTLEDLVFSRALTSPHLQALTFTPIYSVSVQYIPLRDINDIWACLFCLSKRKIIHLERISLRIQQRAVLLSVRLTS